MHKRIVIYASSRKKFFLILGLVVFALLALFLFVITPRHPDAFSFFIYRSHAALVALLILGSLPRVWEILTKPVLVMDSVGLHLTRTSIPWSHIRAVRCENAGQWIYVTVQPVEPYRYLNRVSKQWEFQREDEVFLNFAVAAHDDYLTACRLIRQHLEGP